MNEIILSDSHYDFYEIIKEIHKKIIIEFRIPDYYEIQDRILEFCIDKNIDLLSFEGRIYHYEYLITTYLDAALNILCLAYYDDDKPHNNLSPPMFLDSIKTTKYIYPRRTNYE